MGKGENRTKNQHMAEMLRARGYWHGKRASTPAANSGGLTFRLTDVGSAAYRRLRRSK